MTKIMDSYFYAVTKKLGLILIFRESNARIGWILFFHRSVVSISRMPLLVLRRK